MLRRRAAAFVPPLQGFSHDASTASHELCRNAGLGTALLSRYGAMGGPAGCSIFLLLTSRNGNRRRVMLATRGVHRFPRKVWTCVLHVYDKTVKSGPLQD